ncbi:MAG: flagellar motor stator protein MotA [Alphaproteobacteria bacterium]
MTVIIGWVTVVVCTLGGYAAMGGKLYVLWQPFEVVIIVGSALGAFVAANPGHVSKHAMGAFMDQLKGKKSYDAGAYIELLTLLCAVFKTAKSKGFLALEPHIENPHESTLFQAYPGFMKDHHAVEFLCDYLRMISMGTENPHELADLIDEELEIHHNEHHTLGGAIQTMADGMPALGIVAAVLGVIKTMGSINEPPEVLGKLIGGALVGTFLGVWVSYGFLAPVASAMNQRFDAEGKYFLVMRAAMIAYLQGYAPQVCVEFGRKALGSDVRPSFMEVEEATADVQAA